MATPIAKRTWTEVPVSYIYHLMTYGLSNGEALEILVPIITNRTRDAISGMIVDVKKYISVQQGHAIRKPVPQKTWDLIKKASKIPEIPPISKYKPAKPAEFVPTRAHKDHGPFTKTDLDNVSSAPPQSIVPEVILESQDLTDMKAMIAFAKSLGASEVEWKGAKIKF